MIVQCLLSETIRINHNSILFVFVFVTRGLQRDVVFTSPNAGGGGSCGVSANEYSCTQEPK